MRALSILMLLLPLDALAVCPGGGSESIWYTDADRDGWGVQDGNQTAACDPPAAQGWADRDGDCNDGDADINPGASEVCDDVGTDENCDGSANGPDAAGQLNLYEDADGDGAGDPDRGTSSCIPLAGYVFAPDDCDDSDPAINPLASERCNQLDDDCDGEIDEDPDPERAPRWYPDADGDGSGDGSAEPVVGCDQPQGHVRDDRDCDDDDEMVGPTMREACTPSADDKNCDGLTGPEDGDGDGFAACEDCDDANPDAFPGADDPPYDGVVTDCERADDFDADGDRAIAIAWGGDDCDDLDPATFPGADDLPGDGIDQDCDGEDAVGPPERSCDGCHTGPGPSGGLMLVLFAAARRQRRTP